MKYNYYVVSQTCYGKFADFIERDKPLETPDEIMDLIKYLKELNQADDLIILDWKNIKGE